MMRCHTWQFCQYFSDFMLFCCGKCEEKCYNVDINERGPEAVMFLKFILALIPIIWLIVAMSILKMPGFKACFIAFVITFILAAAAWHLSIINTATAALEGICNALWPIIIVILAALFVYNLTLKTGAMVFYGNLEGAYMSQIEQEADNEEYLLNRALEKLSLNDSTPVTKAMIDEMEIRYGPLKTELVAPVTVAVRWGQDNPYNLSTPIISGQHALNGCVATAVAQMMSYWRFPKSYEWSSMLPSFGAETYSTFQKISNLMSDVGVGVNTKYGKTSSSAYLEDVPAYMASLGFDPGTYGEFNTEQVLASLEDYYPVIVSGSALKKDVYKTYMLFWEKYSHTYYDDNHTWLVDGAIMTYRTIYVTYQGETYQFDRQNQKLLMHCNFGWPELTLDGYYDWGVFDTRQGPVTRGHTNTSGSKGYYQYNVMCVTGIRRLDVTH